MKHATLIILLAFSGCMYRITDSKTGNSYVTSWATMHHAGWGDLSFVDHKTGDEVIVHEYKQHYLQGQELDQAMADEKR